MVTNDHLFPGRRLSRTLGAIVAQWEADPPSGVLTMDDIEQMMGPRVSRAYARTIAKRLVDAGWLARIGRGHYEFVPASKIFPSGSTWLALDEMHISYMVTGLAAAAIRRLTPQLPSRRLVVVPRGASIPARLKNAGEFRFAQMKRERVFGADPVTLDGIEVLVACRERIVVDAVQHPSWFGGVGETARILNRAVTDMHTARLLEYVRRYDARVVAQRTGWWISTLQPDLLDAGELDQLRLLAAGPKGHATTRELIPGLGSNGTFDSSWQLIVNADPAIVVEETMAR